MPQIYLMPGKIAIAPSPSMEGGGGEPVMIKTILGSCVAIVLFDPVARVSGMNHYLLPQVSGGEAPSHRYGSVAIPALIQGLLERGAQKGRLKARIFGGGNVLGDVSVGIGVGIKNIALAESALAAEAIPVVEKNTGGNSGRSIILDCATYEVAHELMADRSGGEGVEISGYAALKAARDVKVLIVDDSATVRTLFEKIFAKNGLKVVGAASTAFEAREHIVREKPDVITLDIEMPHMSGVAFLEKLMQHMPIPTVMVSSLGATGEAALRALELGAVEFVQKPSQYDPVALRELGEVLVGKVRAAASTPLVKSRARNHPAVAAAPGTRASILPRRSSSPLKLVAVSGNAGSQSSLDCLLRQLATDTPPVVIADSTISGFLDAYFQKLKGKIKVGLKVPGDGESLMMGNVYFAPPGKHLKVEARGSMLHARVLSGAPVHGQIPSGTELLRSAALATGAATLGVVLSGFGEDGVEGLVEIQKNGGASWVEDPDAATFPFGPQKAVTLGVVDQVLDLASDGKAAAALMELRNRSV